MVIEEFIKRILIFTVICFKAVILKMNVLENIAIDANYSEVVGRSLLWLFNNRNSLKL